MSFNVIQRAANAPATPAKTYGKAPAPKATAPLPVGVGVGVGLVEEELRWEAALGLEEEAELDGGEDKDCDETLN